METHQANTKALKTREMDQAKDWIDRDLSVYMHSASLEEIPIEVIPEGYEIRTYSPGDERKWLNIHVVADQKNPFSESTFRGQFGTDIPVLALRQFYLYAPDGSAIGTTSAWFKGKIGRIHWVAIKPEYQGRGLAKPLLYAACRRLADLGHREAYLTSSTSRIAALCLYAKFGFRPGRPLDASGEERDYRSVDEKAAWQTLFPAIMAHIST